MCETQRRGKVPRTVLQGQTRASSRQPLSDAMHVGTPGTMPILLEFTGGAGEGITDSEPTSSRPTPK